jgi:threonine dehydratase
VTRYSAKTEELPSIKDIQTACVRIRPFLRRTIILRSRTLDSITNSRLHFKCENFQTSGSFKARGAHNAVFALSNEQAQQGVVTHSSGNHGAALALAARRRGITAQIVVPQNSVTSKVDNIRRYGGKVIFCSPTLANRKATAERAVRETGGHFIHSYDNSAVIAGQGTAAMELLLDEQQLDVIIVPVGGGGLLAGTALAIKSLKPTVAVFGAEPQMVDDAFRSLRDGTLVPQTNLQTVADALRTSLSIRTLTLMKKYVDEILLVSEESILGAMCLIWSILKIVVEPSSAVPLAAVLCNAASSRFAGKHIGIILTGGNVDVHHLAKHTDH